MVVVRVTTDSIVTGIRTTWYASRTKGTTGTMQNDNIANQDVELDRGGTVF